MITPPFIHAMKLHLKRLFRRSKKQSEPSTPATPPSARKIKGAVFRVTGIPLTLSTAALEAAISAEFSAENVTVDPSRTRICSSCSDQKTKVALIGFTPNSPLALDNLPSAGTYEVEIRELRCNISVDRDFHGLTQVYPTRGTVRADIVAVSGLNGHAYGSWRGRGKSQRMWLCDFMREDFPDCRTMIYGYNSKLDSQGSHTILDYTKTFLEELTKARRSQEETHRPIVFIGHSFGGIIVAQALVRAKYSHPQLFLSTRATIFFSTPYRGLVIDDMLAMLGENSPRENLLRSIETQAELLEHELARFIDYSDGFKIVNFAETSPTQKLKRGADGSWARTGEYFMAVGRESSVLQLPGSIEQTLSIEGDHSTMVKFQHNANPGYTSVVRHINNVLSEAPNAGSIGDTLTAASPGTGKTGEGSVPVGLSRKGKEVEVRPDQQSSGNRKERALCEAAAEGRIATVQLMLERGVSLTWKDRNGNTALHLAVQNGHVDVVSLLLQNGADVMSRGFSGATALIMAAANGYKSLMVLLWEKGTDVTATDSNGHTVLHAAAQNGYPELVRLLFDGGVEIISAPGDDTPLNLAASGGFTDVVLVLLEKGAVIMERGSRGYTALHSASMNGHVEVVQLLLARGAIINSRSHKGSTPLTLAATGGHLRVVEFLLENDANIMERGPQGLTALHLAAEEGHVEVVEFLLDKGADTNATDYEGFTALERAAASGRGRLVEMLLTALPESQDEGRVEIVD